MSPSEAMPITTVTKITGAVTVLISCRNASASHFASRSPDQGATSPNTMPAAIATSTQNHSCSLIEATPLVSLPNLASRANVRAAETPVCLWSLWSIPFRENAVRMRSLAGRLLILQLIVVAVTVAAGALITLLVARERTETAAADRSLVVARTIAALPEVAARRDPSALQPLAEQIRTPARVDFVTIMRPDGIRYTHPTPSLIGKHFVGTYEPAARGGTVTETYQGTLGRSVRAVVPVFNRAAT